MSSAVCPTWRTRAAGMLKLTSTPEAPVKQSPDIGSATFASYAHLRLPLNFQRRFTFINQRLRTAADAIVVPRSLAASSITLAR
jgi:hypothetical protein